MSITPPLVISNSTPIIHLAKIGRLALLQYFFGQIVVPQAVWKECTTPGKGRPEIEHILAADWIKTIRVKDRVVTLLCQELDRGEAEAIALAIARQPSLLLLDDSEAREKARLFHFNITGTVGILLRARRQGMIKSLRKNLDLLANNGFRIHLKLRNKLLQEAGEQ